MPVLDLSNSPVDVTEPSNGLSPVPPLENGDHLTRDEFERRYTAMPDLKKAELIEGIVYMGSPVALGHSVSHIYLSNWLLPYAATLPGLEATNDISVRLSAKNMPQPDLVLFVKPGWGGQAQITSEGYVENAPELVVEVANSSSSIDANAKLKAYQDAGVKEYLLYRVRSDAVDWFAFGNEKPRNLIPENGILRSEIFPGLWLNVHALLDRNLTALQGTLRLGMESPAFRDFAAKLNAKQIAPSL